MGVNSPSFFAEGESYSYRKTYRKAILPISIENLPTVSGPANVTGDTKPNWNSASLKSVTILKLSNLYTY
jgi:hypothetical protein